MTNASIKDVNSKGLASFALPEAKSSKTGVSVRYALADDKQWYVLRIKYGKIQVVADAIVEDGTYVYLAKVWKDVRNRETGKKQRKLFPFMNILFVYATSQETENDDVVRVTFGPFEGVTSRVARVARQNRVVVYIKGLQAGLTTAYIPLHFLEKVEKQ